MMENKKVLIGLVDDEVDLVEAWTDFLSEDFDVISSSDPKVFIQELKILQKKPDVILTDLMMPELHGNDFINQLRLNEIKSEVIIISGYAKKKDVMSALNNNVKYIIEKPIMPTELKNKILNVLDHKKASMENVDQVELYELLNDRSNFLSSRIRSIENICTDAGVPLFSNPEELKDYSDFYKNENETLKKMNELNKKKNIS